MTYLVDTNVISAIAPTKKVLDADLAAWLDAMSDRLYLSVITATEIHDGIAKASREGAGRKADRLSAWWQAVEHLYAARILPFDLPTSCLAGRLTDKARGKGHDPGFADAAIAATAHIHDLALLTYNTRHFATFGIELLNPLDGLPKRHAP